MILKNSKETIHFMVAVFLVAGVQKGQKDDQNQELMSRSMVQFEIIHTLTQQFYLVWRS